MESVAKMDITWLVKRFSNKNGWFRVRCIFVISLWMLLTFANFGIGQIRYPEVPRIDAKMALYKYKAGNTIFVDAMPAHDFRKRHVSGSMNIPNDGPQDIARVRKMKLPFPKNQPIIVYCL